MLFLDLGPSSDGQRQLGHAAGDETLASVAPGSGRPAPGIRVDRSVAPEFGRSLRRKSETKVVRRIEESNRRGPARPFLLRESEHFVSARVGSAIGSARRAPEGCIADATRPYIGAQGDRGRAVRDIRRGYALRVIRDNADRERPAARDPAEELGSFTIRR